jgi:hypothetical protein
MDKLVYTGITCYLGQYHFTRGKIYDVYPHSIITNFIVADNAIHFYIKGNHGMFITLDKWRELQINKILTYE